MSSVLGSGGDTNPFEGAASVGGLFHSSSSTATSANDRCFDAIASINVMPNAVAPSAQEWNDIRANMILSLSRREKRPHIQVAYPFYRFRNRHRFRGSTEPRRPYGQNIKTAAKMGSWSSFQGAAAQ